MLDYISTLAFLAAFAFAPIYFLVVGRKWPKLCLASAVVYFVSYLPLTLSGTYTVSNHGGNDWRREWLPKLLMIEYDSPSGRTKTDITTVGAFYWPCIVIDRLLWHRTTRTEV